MGLADCEGAVSEEDKAKAANTQIMMVPIRHNKVMTFSLEWLSDLNSPCMHAQERVGLRSSEVWKRYNDVGVSRWRISGRKANGRGPSGDEDAAACTHCHERSQSRLSGVGLRATEDRTAERAGAVGERFLLDAQRSQNAEVHVRHPRLALPPVGPVLEAHVGSAGDQRRQVVRVVRRARAASEQHDGVVEHAAVAVLIAGQALQEVRHLLAQEQVVLGKLQLPFLVRRRARDCGAFSTVPA